jgi:hypothetical protein
MRRDAKPGRPKVKARPPIARKPLKSEGSRVRDLETRLAEALDQQTATSEILRVISSSPTDVQPVFDAIARHAVALCDGVGGMVVRYDGAVMRLAAYHNVSANALARRSSTGRSCTCRTCRPRPGSREARSSAPVVRA